MVASMLRRYGYLAVPLVLLCVLAWLLSGCAALAQLLPAALGVAQKGAEIYFARHPSADAEARVRAAELAVEIARLSFERDHSEENRAKVVEAYLQLYATLEELGIPAATAPPGGAETDFPLPEPFTLPTPEEVANTL